MNREDYVEEIISLAKTKNNILIQWPTGIGKSRCALEVIKEYCMSPYDTGVVFPKYLIVIPKLVLIDNWKKEIITWLGEDKLSFFSFVTYLSLYKVMDQYWDCIIFDEGHHFTERCKEWFIPERASRVLVLSATVKREVKERLREAIPNLWYHKIGTRTVIDEEILPDPTVFLIPLSLQSVTGTFIYVKNPKGKGKLKVSYNGRWPFLKRKERIEIVCNAQQYYSLNSEDVEYWKKLFKSTQQFWAKNKWLRIAGERLVWLSSIKTPIVKDILKELDNCRTLTFCSSIEQTEQLGKNNIHSKNQAEGVENLKAFNEGRVNHITACSILNEGVNLSSCQVGVFAGLNASEIMVKQRLGRILRHPKPLIILPYFVDTRDEEIVNKMKGDYNLDLTKTIPLQELKREIINFINNETNH